MKLTVEDVYKYKKITVFLDDKEMQQVFEADDEEGYIWQYVLDQNGKPVFDESKTEALSQQLFGKVRFELEE